MLSFHLEHPDVTSIERTGHPIHQEKGHDACGHCSEPVEPGDEKYGYLLEYNGQLLCRDCFEDAVETDMHRDPIAFAQSLMLDVIRY